MAFFPARCTRAGKATGRALVRGTIELTYRTITTFIVPYGRNQGGERPVTPILRQFPGFFGGVGTPSFSGVVRRDVRRVESRLHRLICFDSRGGPFKWATVAHLGFDVGLGFEPQRCEKLL